MPNDGETVDRLARVEVKIDMLLAQRDSHESRISRLEKFMWLAMGLAVASGATDVARVLSAG